MEKSNPADNRYPTYEEVEEITTHIAKTLGRLLEILQIQGVITQYDRDYIGGKINDTEWKEAYHKSQDITEMFSQLFGIDIKDKEKSDEN